MVSALTLISCLLPLCACSQSFNDKLYENLESAALQVISQHRPNHLSIDSISEDNGQRSKRSIGPKIPELDYTSRLIPDPEVMRAQKISDVMTNLKERYAFQQSYLRKVMDSIRTAVRPNSNGVVLKSSLITNLTVLSGVHVKQYKILEKIVWQNSRLTINDLRFKFQDLKRDIIAIEQRIATLLRLISDVVLRNRPSIITGHKRFIGHNEIPILNTTSVVVGSVDRRDLRQVMSNLYRKSRPQVIRGVKHVVKPNLVKKFINSGHINEINFNNQFVTTNTPQIINGLVHFTSQLIVAKDLKVNGKIGGLKVPSDLVFLNRPQQVFASKIFTSPLIIANRVNSLTIDGINVPQLLQDVLLSNGFPQTVNSKLIIRKPLNTQNINVKGMVNNVDISLMASQLVYKNRPVLVRGRKYFILDDVSIKNNLFVGKRLDGLAISSDLLLKNANQIITGIKHFKGLVVFEAEVLVNGLVDGLRLPQDIVTLSRNEEITGPVVFTNGFIVNQDIDARRLVDGVNLSELKQYTLKFNDKLIRKNVRFNRPVSVGIVDLNGVVNGINLKDLFREAIFKDDPNVNIIGTKIFESNVQMRQLVADRINGVNLFDLLSTARNDTVLVPKIFASLTQFKSLEVKGLIGGVNIEQLYNNRISLTKPETITGMKNFVDEMIITGQLIANNINGIVPQKDFVLKSKYQQINGPKIFTKALNANKLVATHPIIVRRRVDNVLIEDLSARAIPLNADNTFPLNVKLVNCSSSHLQVIRHINGLNITNFANNVMSATKSQVVFAPKLFGGDQTFSQIRTSGGISGISLSYLKENAIQLNRLTQIRSPFIFTHPVTFTKPLALDGVLNGINVSYLANDAVYKNINNLILGRNIFKSGFNVGANIHALSLNGLDLSNELLTKTRDHIIKGKVMFDKTVRINGDLLVKGLVNGIDLSEFNDRVMKTNAKNIITGNLELIGATKVKTTLNIMGRLNGINLTQLFNDAVFVNSIQTDITGIKTITGSVNVLGHLNTTSLNHMNIQRLLDDIVFINSPYEQRISAPKIFENDITVNNLVQSRGQAIMRSINGVDLRQLDSEAIRINRPTHVLGVTHFKDLAIIVSNWTQMMGRINGINLLKDAVLLHIDNGSPQVITGKKVFEHLVLNDNAIIKGLVNGFPLKAIEMNTFFTSNDQTITGHKIVKGLVELSSPYNSIKLLNGRQIPDDFITLNGNQSLSALLTFNNPLNIGQNLFVSRLISGQNLTQLATQSLLRDRPQALTHPIKFESIVFGQDVMVDQHVDNVDLSALSNTVKQFTSVVNVSKDVLTTKANRHHYVSDYLFSSLEKSLFEIEFFKLYQILYEIHGNRVQVSNDNVFDIIDTMGSRPTVQSIKYNTSDELFESMPTKPNTDVIHKTFDLNGQEFTAHWSPHSYNFTAHITISGHLVASIGPFVNYIEIFSINPTNVLLVSYQTSTGKVMVHSFESVSNKLMFNQITESIVGNDASKVVAFTRHNQIYVVVAKHYGLNCVTDSTGTLIFVVKNYRSLELIQTLPVVSVEDLVHFESYGKDYLAITATTTGGKYSLSSQSIAIYRSDSLRNKCTFSLIQTLAFENAIQLSSFTFGTIYSNNHYLMAFNASNIRVWTLKGESGFVESWLLSTKSARAVVPVLAANKLYLIVAQSYKCHESMVFRAETVGIDLAPIVFHTKYY